MYAKADHELIFQKCDAWMILRRALDCIIKLVELRSQVRASVYFGAGAHHFPVQRVDGVNYLLFGVT